MNVIFNGNVSKEGKRILKGGREGNTTRLVFLFTVNTPQHFGSQNGNGQFKPYFKV